MKSKTTKRLFAIYCVLVLVFAFAMPAFADGDPLQVVNNLSDFVFSLIRAIGLILLGFGIVQIGLSQEPRSQPKGKWIFDPRRRRDHHVCEGDTRPYYRLNPIMHDAR